MNDIRSKLAKGEACKISGLGTFSLTQRKERNGRNPQTGEPMTIPAQTSVRFKVAKGIKDKLRELADKLKELAGPDVAFA